MYSHAVRLADKEWCIVTLSCELGVSRGAINVYLNGERVLHLSRDGEAVTVGTETLGPDVLGSAEAAEIAMSIKEAVKRDGPFSLDPQAGVRLFGNFKKHAHSGRQGVAAQAVTLVQGLTELEALVAHWKGSRGQPCYIFQCVTTAA